MSAQILDGKDVIEKIKTSLKEQIQKMDEQLDQVPSIVNVMIGIDPSSCSYAKSQQRVAEEVGLEYKLENLAYNVLENELVAYLQKLNHYAHVTGIMLHKPFPPNLNYRELANHISPAKDLEGINLTNVGKLLLGDTKILPCTPAAVMELIKSTGVDLKGKEAVIVGHSDIVGKPLSLLLVNELATVTTCHIGTSEAGKLQEHVSRADILIVAVGKPGLIKGDWIKEGCIVIDVGINKVDDKICGDVEFDIAKEKAGFITPVPGGVGPVTVMMLMKNAVESFKIQKAGKFWE
jgi:methylenetetrahydrofolate dehydrogenase (NADP+) / methenyltetrahydrofolate cyclohydrolase